ncbi:MAG: phospholipase D family protein [Thiolinea sp.]
MSTSALSGKPAGKSEPGYLFMKTTLSFLLLPLLLSGCANLPEGLSYRGKPQPVQNIAFMADQTYVDENGKRHVEQEIFDEVFNMISKAQRFILVDLFLYNDFQGPVKETTRALSGELTERLIQQKKQYPDLQVIVITDPINNVYGGLPSEQFARLRAAEIDVIITDLDKLPDSNMMYSTFWRVFIQPFGSSPGGLLPNPFGEGRVSVRSYLRMLNFKANHRKVVITDQGNDFTGLVTSANPHDGSSAHRNVAVRFNGPAVNDLLETEKAVLAFSGAKLPDIKIPASHPETATTVQVLTESQIEGGIIQTLQNAQPGDRVDISMFYLADRNVIAALKQLPQRKVITRILLDPNKDAFGLKKNGIPNRQVAHELNKAGIPVRWCDTHGEQCHSKMLLARHRDGSAIAILGSANFTSRNLDDLNLETDVAVRGHQHTKFFRDAGTHFELMWNNEPGKHFSTDYEKYKDTSLIKQGLYRFMSATGISTF